MNVLDFKSDFDFLKYSIKKIAAELVYNVCLMVQINGYKGL